MKMICDRGALAESLNLVGGVIVSRTPKPVLTCVKMTAGDAGLTLAATDLEAAIEVTSPRVEVLEPGTALIPADKLSQIVRESVDPTLAIEVDQEAAHVRTQDSHFKIFIFPVDDFPPVPKFEGDADFEIGAADLHRLIARTIFATARESSRYAINGVLVEREGNKLVVVATDGRRLAMARGECKPAKDDDKSGKHSAIVPTKSLNLLLRLFTEADQQVKVRVADNQIFFATDTTLLASNLVEGNFPPYDDVIPRDGDRKATLDTNMLASAVRRAAVLTNEESKGVRMAFSSSGLTITSRAPEMGEAEVNVEIAEYSGEPIDIGFNPQFIVDAVKVIDSEQVCMEMKAPNKPGMIRTGPDFLYVIMPVNLQ
jgi:DNA polymerase-3 subunit beta